MSPRPTQCPALFGAGIRPAGLSPSACSCTHPHGPPVNPLGAHTDVERLSPARLAAVPAHVQNCVR